MQTPQLLAEYEISTNTHRLNVEVIHKFLAEDSYGSPGIPRSIVERTIENSLCFGALFGEISIVVLIDLTQVKLDARRFS